MEAHGEMIRSFVSTVLFSEPRLLRTNTIVEAEGVMVSYGAGNHKVTNQEMIWYKL